MHPDSRDGAGVVGEPVGRMAHARKVTFLPRDGCRIFACAARTWIGLVVVAVSPLAVT